MAIGVLDIHVLLRLNQFVLERRALLVECRLVVSVRTSFAATCCLRVGGEVKSVLQLLLMRGVIKRVVFRFFEDGERLVSDVLELIAKVRQDFGIYASHIDLQLI